VSCRFNADIVPRSLRSGAGDLSEWLEMIYGGVVVAGCRVILMAVCCHCDAILAGIRNHRNNALLSYVSRDIVLHRHAMYSSDSKADCGGVRNP